MTSPGPWQDLAAPQLLERSHVDRRARTGKQIFHQWEDPFLAHLLGATKPLTRGSLSGSRQTIRPNQSKPERRPVRFSTRPATSGGLQRNVAGIRRLCRGTIGRTQASCSGGDVGLVFDYITSGERCHISSFAVLMSAIVGQRACFLDSTCAGTRGVQSGCAGNQSSTLRESFSWSAVSSMYPSLCPSAGSFSASRALLSSGNLY